MAAAESTRFLVLTMIVRIIQVSVMWMLMQTYLTSKCKNFRRRKAAKVSLKTVKAPQLNRKWWTREFQFQMFTLLAWAAWIVLISFVLFICLGQQWKKWYRYIFWFLFNVFVCNAFVLESECVGSKRKTLDFKLDLAHQPSMVYCNESECIDGTRFLYWTMLYPQINMFQLIWRAEKGNLYSA